MFTFFGLLACLALALALTLWASSVGPTSQSDGVGPDAGRRDTTNSTVVQQAHGKYSEAVLRGRVFSAQTAAGGVAPGTALGTTGAFTLYNPANSGVDLVIHKLGMGLISGTIGAGTVHICSSSAGDAVPTGTAITPRNRLVGGATTPNALAFTTSTITTSAAKQIGILASLNAVVIATTANNPFDVEKDIDGEICVKPGYAITLHATAAAGSTPLVVFNASWEERTNPAY